MRVLTFILALASTGLLTPAIAADDFKVIRLEQDVRNLERQVSDLYRQLNALRTQDRTTFVPEPSVLQNPSQTDNRLWLNAAKWARLRVGMSELEVIELLGKPTSMRGDAATASRTLLYATEIGSSGFLGGSVELRNREVSVINKPVLK